MDDSIARMGEVVFSRPGSSELRALGLGSCIGLCVFDPVIKIGCLAHIMLPNSGSRSVKEIGKYADTAIPYVIEQMTARGASKSRLRAAIAGGAQLFAFEGCDQKLDVGKRNIEAVKHLLNDNKLKLVAEDVGGKCGRTMTMNALTGEVCVKLVGGETRQLADLAH